MLKGYRINIHCRRLQEDIKDIQREVQVLRLVGKHENVAELIDVFEDASYVHLILELCKGGELFDRVVSKGTFTEKMAAGRYWIAAIKKLLKASVLYSASQAKDVKHWVQACTLLLAWCIFQFVHCCLLYAYLIWIFCLAYDSGPHKLASILQADLPIGGSNPSPCDKFKWSWRANDSKVADSSGRCQQVSPYTRILQSRKQSAAMGVLRAQARKDLTIRQSESLKAQHDIDDAWCRLFQDHGGGGESFASARCDASRYKARELPAQQRHWQCNPEAGRFWPEHLFQAWTKIHTHCRICLLCRSGGKTLVFTPKYPKLYTVHPTAGAFSTGIWNLQRACKRQDVFTSCLQC